MELLIEVATDRKLKILKLQKSFKTKNLHSLYKLMFGPINFQPITKSKQCKYQPDFVLNSKISKPVVSTFLESIMLLWYWIALSTFFLGQLAVVSWSDEEQFYQNVIFSNCVAFHQCSAVLWPPGSRLRREHFSWVARWTPDWVQPTWQPGKRI